MPPATQGPGPDQDPYREPPADDAYQPPRYEAAPPPASDPFQAPAPAFDAYQAPTNPYQQPPGYAPAQPYQGPGGGVPAPSGNDNAFGVIALVLGILAIPLGCCYGGGVLFGIAALVVGGLGLRKANAGTATNRGLSIAGMVCGGVGVLVGIGFWVLFALGRGLSSYS